MPDEKDLGSLNTNEWERIHQLVSRFEQASEDLEEVDLGLYLPAPHDPLHLLALQELIKSDVEFRWRKGRPMYLEDYLKTYPELKEFESSFPKLLQEEFWVRGRYGDKPDLHEYQERFPEHFDSLQQLIADTVGATEQQTPIGASAIKISNELAHGDALSIGGGYNLVEVIGEGQFGKVWKAEAPGGKLVAVKIINWPLDHPATRRELQSLESIKHLNHPYLLDIHAFYPLNERLIVVMGLADGSLRDRLKARKKQGRPGIPRGELHRLIRETAEVLDFLHERRLQHRDIKPGNLLLSSGHVRIGDLGLARVIKDRTMQMNASIQGTGPYMPPEAWFGKVHENSDQYSLAVSYIELRRGLCPFQYTNIEGIQPEHLQDAPGHPGLTENEREVLLRAGAKKPENRFPNCMALVEALARDLPSETSNSTASSKSQRDSTGTLLPPGAASEKESVSRTPAWRATSPFASTQKDWTGSAVVVLLLLILLLLLWLILRPLISEAGPKVLHGPAALQPAPELTSVNAVPIVRRPNPTLARELTRKRGLDARIRFFVWVDKEVIQGDLRGVRPVKLPSCGIKKVSPIVISRQ